MVKRTLRELYANHTGKASDKWSLYLDEYERLFASIWDRPVRLLEIGVQNGGSLEIWSQFFPNAQAIVGCDINPDCERLKYDDPRIGVIVGDANDPQTQRRILQRSEHFDIVIDDGSHLSSDIVKTFAMYFTQLAEGGIFIVEDLHCSYWDKFEGGLYYPYSSMTFFKRLADVINHEHWGVPKARGEVLLGIFGKYGCELSEASLAMVHSVEFVNSMCVIRKSPGAANSLGKRVISGTLELVVPANKEWSGNPYELDPAFDESNNIWTNRSVPPDEALFEPVRELAASVELIFDLKRSNEQLSRELDEIRTSLSSRTTAVSPVQPDEALFDPADELGASAELILDLKRSNEQLSRELDEIRISIGSRTTAVSPVQPDEAPFDPLGELGASAELVLELKQRNEQLSRELHEIRSSTSWRTMAIPRLLVSGLRSIDLSALRVGSLRPVLEAGMDSLRCSFRRSNWRTVRLRKFVLRRGLAFYRQHMKHTEFGRAIGQYILDRGLISSFDLNFTPLRPDGVASAGAEPVRASDVEVLSQVPGYHISPPLNFGVADDLALHPSINVLLPSLRLKSMSGGPNTALLLASMLAERGERIRLIACDASLEGEESALFSYMERLLNRPIVRDRIEIVDGFDRAAPILIGIRDIFLATAWWTAQTAKYAMSNTVINSFIYLIQDFEPILHEGSTFQARALETYGLPHIPVLNTKLLLDHLVRGAVGLYADPAFAADAIWFDPALDRSHYFPVASQSKKKVLLFYARPSVARRNLFELGLVALRRAVAAGAIDKDNWEVWAMGEKLPPIALGDGVMLNPLPWMSFEDYAERVRTADLMLSLMLSPHPSYPPLEMAASGKLVVTNSFSVKTAERLRAFSPNIIVAEPRADSIGQALENAAGRINCGLPSYDPSGAMALPTDWDQSLTGTISALIARLQDMRDRPLEALQSAAPGLPYIAKNDYEIYRKTGLARRRRDGMYHQTSGLLSFITTAYNTHPRFLEELGNSVFLQDGGMHFEWLILDNGSTEEGTRDALARLARHPGVRFERVESNLGIIGGMRYCLERASGRYILPLDSDDLIEPDTVHVLTRFIEDNDYPALLFTDEDKVDSGRFHSPYFKPDWDPVLFLHSCYIAHLCAIDRQLAIQLGLYGDSSAEGCHDWDSFLRFMLAGATPRHIPEVLYSWRMHSASTSGNIESKSYITESHRRTLQRFLDRSGATNLELVNSPLFQYDVDWWFRRKRSEPQSIRTIVIGATDDVVDVVPDTSAILLARGNVTDLADAVDRIGTDLVHLQWHGVSPLDDEWRWDAMALLELFPDAVMVGGLLDDGSAIVDGPRVFGYGDGCGCPDQGRALTDPGYGARMRKPHTVSAISTAHCVAKASFLKQCLGELQRETVAIENLGLWLGAMAAEAGKRVVYSPFMRARVKRGDAAVVPASAMARWLSRFWTLIPDQRVYSPRLGLAPEFAYREVQPDANRQHLERLRARLLSYSDWLEMHLSERQSRYQPMTEVVSVSLITTVYEGTSIDLLDALAGSVLAQTSKAAEWIIVAHGPIAPDALAHIVRQGADHWRATVIVESSPLGIMGAMRRGLDRARCDYIVPLDADDLLTPDAVQILANSIVRLSQPDMIFSDEDALVEGKPASPYLRAAFDPVLNLESSYIWHLCAINRQRALSLGLYTDPGATWCHDWDSVMRIANGGGRIEHVPEVLYHWRQHTASTTHKPEGDERSIQSVKHILEGQIARLAAPDRFCVAEWPEYRGARELYIARKTDHLPQLIWAGDTTHVDAIESDAVLVVAGNGVKIDSRDVIPEVARLLDLHPAIGAVGGIVIGRDDLVVDGCYMVNRAGLLESPWLGRSAAWAGPYALAVKPQTVTATGNLLAFLRVAAVKRAGLWPLQIDLHSPYSVRDICLLLAKDGWNTAFSPLVRARNGIGVQRDSGSAKPLPDFRRESQALVRYGTTLSHRE
ncbi:glycosyltransferase [Bradyrhizobium sp. 30]|uniref:rhamnosyltransferase WsaF family glycosyltransferase n=1 Tax=Bradyrhizobium sp. 30 TaxID=2782669 RepID=UPI001FF9930C|nr:glycosyltransferase [Bradyrhizobium sp. 30]MCK1291977.1 glycosyltransferase [Bradyrhizobium sp. 30]